MDALQEVLMMNYYLSKLFAVLLVDHNHDQIPIVNGRTFVADEVSMAVLFDAFCLQKAVTDEKSGPASSCNICTSSTTHVVPTPLPLPSFETITSNEAEYGDTQKQPLPIPEAISLADSVQSLNEEEHMEEEIRGYNDEEEEEEDVEEEELEKKKNHNHEEEIRRDDVIEVDEEAFLDKQDEQQEEIVANGVESAHGEDNHRINYVSEEDEEESEAAVTRIQQRFAGPLVKFSIAN